MSAVWDWAHSTLPASLTPWIVLGFAVVCAVFVALVQSWRRT